jgi:hypothetical protein
MKGESVDIDENMVTWIISQIEEAVSGAILPEGRLGDLSHVPVGRSLSGSGPASSLPYSVLWISVCARQPQKLYLCAV